MSNFLRSGFIVGPFSHFSLALSLILAGMGLAGSGVFAWASIPVLALGLLLCIVPIVFAIVHRFSKVQIFMTPGEGLKFFESCLQELHQRGGALFSTYLAERADLTGDIVCNLLADLGKSPRDGTVIEYSRILLLDDPTLEKRWVNEFFSVIESLKDKVNIAPILYSVESPSRNWVRRIQSVLPRAAISLVKYGDVSQVKYVYISISPITDASGSVYDPVFAIALRSPTAYDNLLSYLNHIVETDSPYVRKIRSSSDLLLKSKPRALPSLTERLLSCIEEIAHSSELIQHVGVFGSIPTELVGLNRGIVQLRTESDLDLIVVISSKTDEKSMKDLKSLIKDRFAKEASIASGPDVELEWSLERSTFYHFREDYHVDIQLHKQGDDYYITEARLLGYSIFWGGYYTVYSSESSPVDAFLRVPRELISEHARLTLFLEDPLGLQVFLDASSNGDVRIDPRRVLAINLANWLWAITGMCPISTDHALQVALTQTEERNDGGHTYAVFPKTTLEAIVDVIQQETEDLKSHQPEYLEKVVLVLAELKQAVVARTKLLKSL